MAPIVTVGILACANVKVVEHDDRIDAALAAAERQVRETPPPESAIAAVRALYKRIGLDPTKTRPSSEALLRRVRRGAPLPRINSLVDICNWCSLELQLPYGLYDLDQVRGAIELRLGRAGEHYPGIRKEAVHVGGRLVLADEEGAFGNPTSDSARTMVTTATHRALFVIFGPRTIDPRAVVMAVDLTCVRVTSLTGAVENQRQIL